MARTVELVRFDLKEGITSEAFVKKVTAMAGWLAEQPGFVSRRLSQNEEVSWTDHLEWESLAAAKAASAAIGTAKVVEPFLEALNMEGIRMDHAALAYAQDGWMRRTDRLFELI